MGIFIFMPYKYKISAIYTITNLVNGKMYVGYSSDYNGRRGTHLNMLRGGYHHCKYLQNAWDKYGEKNFKIEILEEYPENLLVAMEHYWATTLNTHNPDFGYNDRETDPYEKIVWTEDRKKEISNTLRNSDKLKIAAKESGLKRRGRKMLREQTEKQFITRKKNAKERGYYHSKETLKKISDGNRGKTVSKEVRQKQSESRKELMVKRPDLSENIIKFNKNNPNNYIICIYKTGKTEEYRNLIDMSNTLKIPLASLRSVSKGRYKNYKNELTIIKKSIYDKTKDYSHLFKK